MLNAIRFGKKRGTGTEGEDLAMTFSGAEDTLTATVFERLLYLPDEVVAAVLLEPFGERPEGAKVRSFQFWPRWERADVPGYKEPDVVIEWGPPDVVLVVEAKRYDFAEQQDPAQLAAEWEAARERFPERPVWLLAVGGIPDTREATIRDIEQRIKKEFATTSDSSGHFQFRGLMWFQLYERLEEALGDEPEPHVGRLLDDIREGMLLHGVTIAKPVWLSDLLEPPWTGILGIRDGAIQSLKPEGRPPPPVNLQDLAALGPIRSSADDLTRAMGGQP